MAASEGLTGRKKCPKCGKTKRLDRKHFIPRKRRPGQYYAWCRACMYAARKAKYKDPEWAKQWRAKKRQLKWAKFGFTQEEYDLLVKQQRGRCAICRRKPPRLFVDHDHETNTFRGLICPRCNSYLGYIKDDPESLRRAVVYLERP